MVQLARRTADTLCHCFAFCGQERNLQPSGKRVRKFMALFDAQKRPYAGLRMTSSGIVIVLFFCLLCSLEVRNVMLHQISGNAGVFLYSWGPWGLTRLDAQCFLVGILIVPQYLAIVKLQLANISWWEGVGALPMFIDSSWAFPVSSPTFLQRRGLFAVIVH